MTNKKEIIEGATIIVVAALLLVIVSLFLAIITIPIHALLLMLAWNYALIPLFKLPEISFWQSIALVIIARILIRSSTNQNVNSKS
jgi:hypothetical protein